MVELAPEMAADLHAAVAGGEFGSVSEIVAAALEAWQAQRALEGWDTGEVRRLVQEGMDSGPGIPAEQVFDRLLARYRAM